jgi:formate dehydrogenase major subunit
MLAITINGKEYSLPNSLSILQALRQAGLEVPQLCHDPRLKPSGACRLCVVQVDGEALPVSACNTALRDGMAIHTHGAEIEALRRTNLALLAEHYPLAAHGEAAETQFQRYLRDYGIAPGGKRNAPLWRDDSHPYIGVEMDRCIHCNRCVRICEEVQGQFVWQAWGRGEQTHIAPASGDTLQQSDCTSCGACVDSCPSGALFDQRSAALGQAERWTRSTCVYCGVGCQMDVGSRAGAVVGIRPAMGAVNRGHLCAKGRYAFEFNGAPDRVTEPMIRRDGQWQPASWDEALTFIAARLQDIVRRDGADAVGVLGSARATNEENYLIQKFARVVLGTNNVDCCARVCHQPSAAALKAMLGTGAATNSFDCIEQAGVIMVCGANPTENHPIVGARIKQAVLKGAKLIVVDPRATELARMADIHLQLRPGHNVQLFNAIACTILDEGLEDRAFIAERVGNVEAFAAFVKGYAPEAVGAQCEVAPELIRAAARLYATGTPAMQVHGLGMTEHCQGTEGVMTLINLALITGNLGKPGSGVNPLRGQNNVQGSAHMGCEPKSLTGGQSLEQARAHFEQVWGVPLPTSEGLTLPAMMDAAGQGKLKALWAVGYDIYPTLANASSTANSLAKLELVIVQDLFLTETAQAFGHVFLPAASVFEKDGTFMNADRRVQRVRQAVAPPGRALADWQIVQALARHMGQAAHFGFDSPQAIWDEVRRVWPGGAGLSYARLDGDSPQWPCPNETHAGTPVLHKDSFPIGKRAALRMIAFVPTAETTDAEFPMLLSTGRTLQHFNAGTMTYRTPQVRLQESDYLDISPQDGARLGIGERDQVRVVSRYGTAVLPARLNVNVNPGMLFATFHLARLFVNRLTSARRDQVTKAPEYKVTAVHLEKVE